MRRESGFSYLELLIAALVLAIATVGALATWSYSSRAPANKRVTEMGVYVAVQEIERLKARRYMGLEDTPAGSPLVTYYDRYGAPSASGTPQPQGYKVKAFITPRGGSGCDAEHGGPARDPRRGVGQQRNHAL